MLSWVRPAKLVVRRVAKKYQVHDLHEQVHWIAGSHGLTTHFFCFLFFAHSQWLASWALKKPVGANQLGGECIHTRSSLMPQICRHHSYFVPHERQVRVACHAPLLLV